MNEKIKQLVEKAWAERELVTESRSLDEAFTSKFAELIVRECIDIVKPTPHHEAYPQCYLGDVDGLILLENKVKKIKEYFGVDE